jgi:uncharacterized membrane-anchored protein YhcB (DUF1043 family)
MSSLLELPLLIPGAAFVVGWIIGMLFKRATPPSTGQGESGRDHKIRALDADLRVTNNRVQELEEQLLSRQKEFEAMSEECDTLVKTVEARNEELAKARTNLVVECKKTAKLRRELTGRAEETIRANVQIKDIETELDVAQAGSNVVAEQLQRLEAEKEDLHDKLERSITGVIEADDESPEEPVKESSKDTFILDS